MIGVKYNYGYMVKVFDRFFAFTDRTENFTSINTGWQIQILITQVNLGFECVSYGPIIMLGCNQMRPVPTKWETSRKISFLSYNQIHVAQTLSFKMIYYLVMVADFFGVQKLFFPCEIPLFSIDFWNVQWAISPLVPWWLVAHFVRTGLK